MLTGKTVLVDFPSHPWHGKKCQVVADEELFDIAPEGGDPYPCRTIFIRRTTKDEPIGFPLERLAGTAENARLREEEAEDDGRQGELLL